jgi:hypothetical protein
MNVNGASSFGAGGITPSHGVQVHTGSGNDPVIDILNSISEAEWQNICNRSTTQKNLFENPAWTQTIDDLRRSSQSDKQRDYSVYLYSQKLYESTAKHGVGNEVCVFVFDESNFNRSSSSSQPPALGTLHSARDGSYIRATWRGIDFSTNPPIQVLTDDVNILISGQNTININGFSFPIQRLDETSKKTLLQSNRLINHSAPANFFERTISKGRLESKEERLQSIKLTSDVLKAHEPKIIRLTGLDQARFFRELEAELNRRIDRGELSSTANTDILKQWLSEIP